VKAPAGAERGVALIVALLMLVAILLLGVSAAQIALHGEKTSRNERDRQIAFQAAEAALMDAETDIEHSPFAKSAARVFAGNSTVGFPDGEQVTCGTGTANPFLGLCNRARPGTAPAWQTVDFLNQSDGASSVPYGHFTGQQMQTGAGSLPARLPRYVIEPLPYRPEGQEANKANYVFRITAIGFGVRDSTQVLLQSIYRKEF
jgi:type IV pilus assembly protein PilX